MKLNAGFSATGLLVGTVFFAFSLTPSLLPRSEFLQGVIAGLSLAAGYAVGVFGHWLWTYLELPKPKRKTQFYLRLSAEVVCGVIAVAFLWQASGGQNSIRSLMAFFNLPTPGPVWKMAQSGCVPILPVVAANLRKCLRGLIRTGPFT